MIILEAPPANLTALKARIEVPATAVVSHSRSRGDFARLSHATVDSAVSNMACILRPRKSETTTWQSSTSRRVIKILSSGISRQHLRNEVSVGNVVAVSSGRKSGATKFGSWRVVSMEKCQFELSDIYFAKIRARIMNSMTVYRSSRKMTFRKNHTLMANVFNIFFFRTEMPWSFSCTYSSCHSTLLRNK